MTDFKKQVRILEGVICKYAHTLSDGEIQALGEIANHILDGAYVEVVGDLLTTTEVSKLLGYRQSTVCEYLKAGKLKGVKRRIGGHYQWLIHRDNLPRISKAMDMPYIERGEKQYGSIVNTSKDWAMGILHRENWQCRLCGLEYRLETHHIVSLNNILHYVGQPYNPECVSDKEYIYWNSVLLRTNRLEVLKWIEEKNWAFIDKDLMALIDFGYSLYNGITICQRCHNDDRRLESIRLQLPPHPRIYDENWLKSYSNTIDSCTEKCRVFSEDFHTRLCTMLKSRVNQGIDLSSVDIVEIMMEVYKGASEKDFTGGDWMGNTIGWDIKGSFRSMRRVDKKILEELRDRTMHFIS